MGVSPGRLYILSLNSTGKGLALVFYHDRSFGVKWWGRWQELVGGSGAYYLNGKLHHVRLILSGRFISGALGYSAS